MKSLRARLLVAVVSVTLGVWGIAVVASYHGAHHEAEEFLDGQLAQSARLLLAQIRHEMGEIEATPSARSRQNTIHGELANLLESPRLHEYEQPLEFHIWTLDTALPGRAELLLRSSHMPALALDNRSGYTTLNVDGQEWRTLSVRDATGRFQVEVAQPTRKRDRAALEVALRVSVPFIIALPLLMVLLFLAVGRGLQPLERLARDVGQREPHALTPLPTRGMPREALPLVRSLNALLARLERALDNERRFTADAAHELRTPLAALKVQAQVAQMAPDDATRNHALEQLALGVDRATHLVEQLLRLARLDPLDRLPATQQVALAPLLAGMQAAANSNGEDQETRITLNLPADSGDTRALTLHADPDLLTVALRNLVDNALRHGPAPGAIEIGAARAGNHVKLWVRDTGAGVPSQDLARLTERFFRGTETRSQGSGLGLAIVQRIAHLHGGTLHLANLEGGGFQATLSLPWAESPG